jgi:membrane protein required for colicin V production
MNGLDYAWLAVLGLSLLLGLWRGVIREVFSLAGWIAAILAAMAFAGQAAAALPEAFATPVIRQVIAFAVIFVLVLLALSIVGLLLSRLFRAAGLGFADRVLGAVFGLARGALILMLAVFAAAFTPLPSEPTWRESALTPAIEAAVLAVKPWLPPRLAERVHYKR